MGGTLEPKDGGIGIAVGGDLSLVRDQCESDAIAIIGEIRGERWVIIGDGDAKVGVECWM